MDVFKVEIKDTNGKEWGIFNVASLNWNQGKLFLIEVDWYKNGGKDLPMFDYEGKGEFKNSHGNLIGKILK